MSNTVLFLIIFGSIMLFACVFTWMVMYGPRVVVHKHYHDYKWSKDFSRLWWLINNVNIKDIVIRTEPHSVFRYDTIWRYHNGDIIVLGEHFDPKKNTEEDFIVLCKYKKIEFLEPIIEDK